MLLDLLGRDASTRNPMTGRLAVVVPGAILASCVAAHSVPASLPRTALQDLTANDQRTDWDLAASVYLWVASKTGVVQTEGLVLPLDDPDESSGAFVYVEAQQGPWGLVLDLDFLSTDDESPGPNGPVEVKEDTFIGELDATWSPHGSDTLRLILGIRVLDSSQDFFLPVLPDQSADTTLVDPVLGAQGTWPLTETVSFRLRADLGGFGVDSDLTYQTFGLFAWEFARRWNATAGYRILGWEFEDDGIRSDLRLSGVLVGIAARF